MSCADPNYQPRNLIICFDGTGNSFNTENTNVVRLFSALDKQATTQQLCYYQPGIGTYVSPAAAWSKTLTKISEKIDYGIAWYLDEHIMGGYRFIMQNFTKGDKICIFGFSRGAYTARCLAGMLHKVGILPRSNEENIMFAYQRYIDTTPEGLIQAQGFKAAFSTPVDIEFLGVWDTVASVGITARHLPFTSSNTIIKTFRQGLSLDERRVKFQPNPWHKASPTLEGAEKDPECGSAVPRHLLGRILRDVSIKMKKPPPKQKTDQSDDPGEDVYFGGKETDVKEVWFAGGHTDVGGGSVVNNEVQDLAHISLAWMLNELIAAGVGFIFKQDAFADIQGLQLLTAPDANPFTIDTGGDVQSDPFKTASDNTGAYSSARRDLMMTDATAVSVSPTNDAPSKLTNRTVSTRQTSQGAMAISSAVDNGVVGDVTAKGYDALARRTFYWILEWFPTRKKYQDAEGHWHVEWEVHNGRGRVIQEPNPLFHSSVRMRMQMVPGYRPKATYTGTATFVD